MGSSPIALWFLREITQFLCRKLSEKISLLLRRERLNDFLKARIAAERVPVLVEVQGTVSRSTRDLGHVFEKINRAVHVTCLSINPSKPLQHEAAIHGVFRWRKQLSRAFAFPNCICRSSESGVDLAKNYKRSGVVRTVLRCCRFTLPSGEQCCVSSRVVPESASNDSLIPFSRNEETVIVELRQPGGF